MRFLSGLPARWAAASLPREQEAKKWRRASRPSDLSCHALCEGAFGGLIVSSPPQRERRAPKAEIDCEINTGARALERGAANQLRERRGVFSQPCNFVFSQLCNFGARTGEFEHAATRGAAVSRGQGRGGTGTCRRSVTRPLDSRIPPQQKAPPFRQSARQGRIVEDSACERCRLRRGLQTERSVTMGRFFNREAAIVALALLALGFVCALFS